MISADTQRTLKQKITAAFLTLRRKGYITRQAFMCCGTCASYEIDALWRVKGIDDDDRKAVYFSRQGELDLLRRGDVYVNWAGNSTEIVAAMIEQGLDVDHNGKESGAIRVGFFAKNRSAA